MHSVRKLDPVFADLAVALIKESTHMGWRYELIACSGKKQHRRLLDALDTAFRRPMLVAKEGKVLQYGEHMRDQFWLYVKG